MTSEAGLRGALGIHGTSVADDAANRRMHRSSGISVEFASRFHGNWPVRAMIFPAPGPGEGSMWAIFATIREFMGEPSSGQDWPYVVAWVNLSTKYAEIKRTIHALISPELAKNPRFCQNWW